eukprot:c2547_g1_i1.p1 GENE.c2547_g1_i1~~c2547_g1_i1.p1  ORF type:complete len:694 (+),score=110.75 c2547_g1_i1:1004-3085(+)
MDFTNFTDLLYLNVSSNSLIEFPNVQGCSNLEAVDISHNHLRGTIPSHVVQSPSLKALLLQDNKLEGSIPPLNSLRDIEVLYLANNQLTGSLPSLVHLNQLRFLLLSRNRLTGAIPSLPSSLEALVLFSNHLSGKLSELPQKCFNSSDSLLLLHENLLSCGLSDTRGVCDHSYRAVVAVGNKFSGDDIPCWVPEVERIAKPLWTHKHDWQVPLGLTSSACVLLFVLLTIRFRTITTETNHLDRLARIFVKASLRLCFPSTLLLIVILISTFVLQNRLYKCGDALAQFSISILGNSSSIIDWCVVILGLIFGIVGIIVYKLIHHETLEMCQAISHEADFRVGWMTYVKLAIGTLLIIVSGSVCTVLSLLLESLPSDNPLKIGETGFEIIGFIAPPLLSIVTEFVVPFLCHYLDVWCTRGTLPDRHKLTIELVVRSCLAIWVPILVTSIVHNDCFQFWKSLWLPCYQHTSDFDVELNANLRIASRLFAVNLPFRTSQLCTQQFKRGHCVSTVMDKVSTLLLGKVLFQAGVMNWFLFIFASLPAKKFCCWDRITTQVRNHLSAKSTHILVFTWLEIALLFGFASPLLAYSVALVILSQYLVIESFRFKVVRQQTTSDNVDSNLPSTVTLLPVICFQFLFLLLLALDNEWSQQKWVIVGVICVIFLIVCLRALRWLFATSDISSRTSSKEYHYVLQF